MVWVSSGNSAGPWACSVQLAVCWRVFVRTVRSSTAKVYSLLIPQGSVNTYVSTIPLSSLSSLRLCDENRNIKEFGESDLSPT